MITIPSKTITESTARCRRIVGIAFKVTEPIRALDARCRTATAAFTSAQSEDLAAAYFNEYDIRLRRSEIIVKLLGGYE